MKITDKQIIEVLKAGKCVRRKEWLQWLHPCLIKLYIGDDFIDNDGDTVILGLSDIIADDWEVIES